MGRPALPVDDRIGTCSMKQIQQLLAGSSSATSLYLWRS